MAESVFKQALTKWGTAAQLDMVVEECLELALAMKHWSRGKVGVEEIASEVVDVEIMLQQLRLVIGNWSHVSCCHPKGNTYALISLAEVIERTNIPVEPLHLSSLEKSFLHCWAAYSETACGSLRFSINDEALFKKHKRAKLRRLRERIAHD